MDLFWDLYGGIVHIFMIEEPDFLTQLIHRKPLLKLIFITLSLLSAHYSPKVVALILLTYFGMKLLHRRYVKVVPQPAVVFEARKIKP